jgi:hypothetical protein
MIEISAAGHAHGSPKPKGGARPDAGRKRVSKLLSTVKFRELCIKHGPRALEIIMDIAEHGEPDAARFLAAKFIIERGYGVNPDEPPGDGARPILNIITGVRGETVANPPQRPLLPDGRDPFEQPPAPASSRPVGRAPVAEPVQHRLFEGEPEGPLKERS